MTKEGREAAALLFLSESGDFAVRTLAHSRGDALMSSGRLLTEIELAERTGVPVKTWQHLRRTGGGVPFVKLGRLVRYPEAQVDEWIKARKQLRTRESGKVAKAASNIPTRTEHVGRVGSESPESPSAANLAGISTFAQTRGGQWDD